MGFTSWLRNWNGSGTGACWRAPKSTRKRAACRLTLEALEGRVVPSTLTVTTNANTGAGSLRTEINVAHSGDTIVFSPSLAYKPIYALEVPINKNLTIQGLGASQLTLDGIGMSRVFDVSPGAQVSLSGLTIEYGSPAHSSLDGGEGGGILNQGTLTLSGCTVSNCTAPSGGGIYNLGTLTLSGCTISNNKANEGGGIYNTAGATLTISQSTLSGDSAAGLGGAIYNSGNAGVHSGGIATISDCTLSGDSATSGGGIYNAGKATISGCTLSGDSASPHGGGIYNAGALTVLDSIFSGNTPDNINGSYTDGGGNTFN
jgi:hypothetical protein